MVRPADEGTSSLRTPFLLGAGTTLGSPAEAPLMSDAIRWGDLLFLSGRAAVDPSSGAARGDDFDAQCAIVLADVGAVLVAAGSGVEHVLRVECWLTSRADFSAWNEAFKQAFPAPRPARTTTLGELPLPGLLVELQVTAGVPS
jgi:2-iminobutanoate/2-iminopropanoate deaminase